MRLYRFALLVFFVGSSMHGLAKPCSAQSFDYPENSKTLFNRWSDKMPTAAPHVPVAPQTISSNGKQQGRSLLKKLLAGPKLSDAGIVQKIKGYDSKKSYLFGGSYAAQSQQPNQRTTYLERRDPNAIERSILEVDGIPRSTARYDLSPSQPSIDFSRQSANLSSNLQSAVAKQSGTTQRMVEQHQARVAKVPQPPARMSAPSPGSFDSEFSKAYQYLNGTQGKTAADNSVRVAALPNGSGNPITEARGKNRFNSGSAQGFDVIPKSLDERELELPPLAPADNTAPEFSSPRFDELPPNQNPSDFAPPSEMKFDLPAEANRRTAQDLDGLEDFKSSPELKADDVAPGPIELLNSNEPSKSLSSQPEPREPVAPPSRVDVMQGHKSWVPPQTRQLKDTAQFPEVSNDQQSARLYQGDDQVTWWKSLVAQPLNPQNNSQAVDTNGLVLETLRRSPRIKAVSKTPLIRELQVVEADAEFDPVTFLQSQFQDRNDPVGNSLTTGGDDFLRDNIWSAEGGIRRRLRNGADYELSQTLGFQNSNSTFFTPQDQGTATLALNVTQPLLRGRGEYVNQAQILIAQSTGGAAWDTFKSELQQELEGMVSAYWDLYLQRSIYLQKKRNVERGQVMLDRLNGRRELDANAVQIARARSAVLTRKTELANAFRDVRNAETEIRRRIADQNWLASQSIELLPAEMPYAQANDLQLEQVVYTALENRPEIAEAIRRIRIAGVQRDVSSNDLLPELSFLFGTYVSALRGDTGIGNAFQDQFGQVRPGYTVGLEFELPYRNRAARSRLQQRSLQFKRLQNELEDVIQSVIAESQVAARQVSSAFETLTAAEQAVKAAKSDLELNEQRWESFALIEGDIAEGQSPTTVLDQLLDSQERLAQSENVYSQAEQELKVAEITLQRIMGTLLLHQQVDFSRSVTNDSPEIHIHKNDQPAHNSHQYIEANPQIEQATYQHTEMVQPSFDYPAE